MVGILTATNNLLAKELIIFGEDCVPDKIIKNKWLSLEMQISKYWRNPGGHIDNK